MNHENVPPQACLDPEAIAAMAEGRLVGAERAAAVKHLAGCRHCRELLVSTVQILEEDGLLPVVAAPAAMGERAPAPAPKPRSPVMLWLSAAAALLASAVVFVHRAPVLVPRVADASPSPGVSPTSVPSVSPSAPVQTAAFPPEAIEALRTLRGYASAYAVPPARGFAPDPSSASVRRGVEDADAAAHALSTGAPVPVPTGEVDRWRRVGRILEASRLVLAAPESSAHEFFSSEWTRRELAHAATVLREAGVADAQWAEDVLLHPLTTASTEPLLDRLDALLRSLS